MIVRYAPASSKVCGDCLHYKADKSNPKRGTCFGHEVKIAGTCNFFKDRIEGKR